MKPAEGSERGPPVKEEDGTFTKGSSIPRQEKGEESPVYRRRPRPEEEGAVADDPMARDCFFFDLEKGYSDAVEQQQGAIAWDVLVEEPKGGEERRTRTATEDEQATDAAGLLIPHVDEEAREALVAESTTPLTEAQPVPKVTENSPMEVDEEDALLVDDAADRWLRCPVCFHLLFKPAAVTACGHIHCMDCLLEAMNIAGVSTCTLCRNAYDHFPGECTLISTLVQKSVKGEFEGKQIVGDKVQLEDVTCDVCKEILCEPSVLNCGHVFCISCLTVDGDTIKCPSCSAVHANEHPVVCSYVNHFIKACFPEEYKLRIQKVGKSSGTLLLEYKGQSRNVKISRTHVGVGCDSCGNTSIQGRFGQQHPPDHVLELNDSFLFTTVLSALNEKNEDGGEEPRLPEDGEEEQRLAERPLGLLWASTNEDGYEPEDFIDDELLMP
ncbi:unnamed protein product [Urochloa decumbens]|uniref:RING-type domain-containing protein n=1 Tax=Urochloa decumbens TaxID=240449 RepID=A0ABC8VBJ1_9POAL